MIYNFELENDARIKLYCNLFFTFWRIRDDEFVYLPYMIKTSVFIFRLSLHWWRTSLSWCHSTSMTSYHLFGWYSLKALTCILKPSVDFITDCNTFSIKFDFFTCIWQNFWQLEGICLIVHKCSCSDHEEAHFKGLHLQRVVKNYLW